MLQFTDGEEGVGAGIAFLRLDREEIRHRRGVNRHLERSELTFSIEGDNPGPTSEADIVNNKWGWGNHFEERCWKTGLTTREQKRRGREGMMGTQERGEA